MHLLEFIAVKKYLVNETKNIKREINGVWLLVASESGNLQYSDGDDYRIWNFPIFSLDDIISNHSHVFSAKKLWFPTKICTGRKDLIEYRCEWVSVPFVINVLEEFHTYYSYYNKRKHVLVIAKKKHRTEHRIIIMKRKLKEFFILDFLEIHKKNIQYSRMNGKALIPNHDIITESERKSEEAFRDFA